ncbi:MULTISPECIES: ORF6C domain-containing protein [unclassified Moraxella]|uniref:transcriptional regulator n=1 Tax=unclassified Moraxella TaxID=2685852 RepID=UPI003AF9FAAD
MLTKEDMGIRLVEERSRLGYSQANLAHQTGKTREQMRLYEVGKSVMSAEFLAQASQLGLDIQYIITGIESKNISDVMKAEEKETITNNIQGNVSNSVFAGSGSTVHQVNTQQHITRTKAEVKAGDEHITDEQKANLQRLVNEIVEAEQKYRTPKSAKSFRAVWASLNKHLKVTSYHLIPLEKYETARKYLQQWIGRLTSTKTALKTDIDSVRKRQYSYIHTNIKKLNLQEWYDDYLQKKFDVTSSTQLDNDQLRKLYNAVAYQVGKANTK